MLDPPDRKTAEVGCHSTLFACPSLSPSHPADRRGEGEGGRRLSIQERSCDRVAHPILAPGGRYQQSGGWNDDALTKGPGTHLDTTPGADTMDSSLHEDLKPGQKVRSGNGVTFLVKICLPTPEQAGGSSLPCLRFLFISTSFLRPVWIMAPPLLVSSSQSRFCD